MPAPNFTLHVSADQTLSLSDLKGKPVILVFYTADWSPVCDDEYEYLSLFNMRRMAIIIKIARIIKNMV